MKFQVQANIEPLESRVLLAARFDAFMLQYSGGTDLNDQGQVVVNPGSPGYLPLVLHLYRGQVRGSSIAAPVGAIFQGGTMFTAHAINNQGIVVGEGDFNGRGVNEGAAAQLPHRKSYEAKILDAGANSEISYAEGINSVGTIIGSWLNKDQSSGTFLASTDGTTIIDRLEDYFPASLDGAYFQGRDIINDSGRMLLGSV